MGLITEIMEYFKSYDDIIQDARAKAEIEEALSDMKVIAFYHIPYEQRLEAIA
jgi:hypothetical protein